VAETEETIEAPATRSQMWIHEGMVEWLETEEGGEFDFSEAEPAEIIAAAFAKRVAWRQSDTYAELKEAHKAEAEEAKAAKAAERAAAKEARAAEKAAAAEAKAKADAEKGEAKPAAKKAAATTKKAPAGRKPARGKAKASGSDDPFDS